MSKIIGQLMAGKHPKLFQRLFFACPKQQTTINKQAKKSAPPASSHSRQQSLHPSTTATNV